MVGDGAGLGVEYPIQNGNDLLAGDVVGEFCEAAQIGRPQNRSDRFAAAAPDLAGQHPWAGLRAEISDEYVLGDMLLVVHVD